MLVNRDKGEGGAVSLAAPIAWVTMSPMSETAMSNERKIVFII
jgi:hypothetical protein